MVPAPHQWSGKLGSSGDTHQDDGDDGQHDVDALPQQDSGVTALELDRLLLLLLLELQLGHSCLTRLQSLLRKTMERKFVSVDVSQVAKGHFTDLLILDDPHSPKTLLCISRETQGQRRICIVINVK